MSGQYEINLPAEVKKAFVVRFAMGCVDWSAIGDSAERELIDSNLKEIVEVLIPLSGVNYNLDWPKLNEVRSAGWHRRLVRLANFAHRSRRPGAEFRIERQIIWFAQKRACERIFKDQQLVKLLNQCREGRYWNKFRVPIEALDHAKEDLVGATLEMHELEYVGNGTQSALDGLLSVRVALVNAVFGCARVALRVRNFRWQEEKFFQLFRNTIHRTDEEERCASAIYRVLSTRLMLVCTPSNKVAVAHINAVNAAIETAPDRAKRAKVEDFLAIPEETLTSEAITRFEEDVASRWLTINLGAVPSLWASERAAIEKLLGAIESAQRAYNSFFQAANVSQRELKERWAELQIVTIEPNQVDLACAVRLRASLIVTFLRLVQTVLRSKENDSMADQWERLYHDATWSLCSSEHSLGSGHILGAGSHAISQRTANRYNII